MNEIEQKEIEEIFKVIKYGCLGVDCDECVANKTEYRNKCNCEEYYMATKLYNAGYRNCKDKVVLSKEELQELKKYKTDWLNSEKIHLQGELEYTEFELNCAYEAYSTLSKLYDETKEKLGKYIEFNNNLIIENQTLKDKLTLARQETAREIISKLKELSQEKMEQTLFDVYKFYTIGSGALDELAKEYGVEAK